MGGAALRGEEVPEQVEEEVLCREPHYLSPPTFQSYHEAWRLVQGHGFPEGPATSLSLALFPKERGRNTFIILIPGSGIPHWKMQRLDEPQAARWGLGQPPGCSEPPAECLGWKGWVKERLSPNPVPKVQDTARWA